MMRSNSSQVIFDNCDENSNRLVSKNVVNRDQHHYPIKGESSTASKLIQPQQQNQRRPLQNLNINTSSSSLSESFGIDSMRSLSKYNEKMAKSQQHAQSENVSSNRNTSADEESSTISAQENKVQKCHELNDTTNIFRRRMDAQDETFEEFWELKHANPILDEDDDSFVEE